MVLHHVLHDLLPLILLAFSLVLSFLFLSPFAEWIEKHVPLLLLCNLIDSGVGIFIGPPDWNDLVAVQGLVGHGFLGVLGHTAMGILHEGITLVWEDVYVLDLPPKGKVSQEYLVHLGDSVVISRYLEVADVNGLGLLGEWAHSLHVLTVSTEPGPTENVLGLIDQFTVTQFWNLMQEFAIHSVRTAPSGKEEAEEGASFLIEEIGGRITHI